MKVIKAVVYSLLGDKDMKHRKSTSKKHILQYFPTKYDRLNCSMNLVKPFRKQCEKNIYLIM